MPALSRDCFFKSISVRAWPAYYAQSSHHPLSFSLPFSPSGNPGSESWCRAGPVLPSSQRTPEQRLGCSGIMYISPNPALGTPSPWHRDNPALPPCVPHGGTAPVPLPPDTHLLVQTFSSTATPQLLSQWERGALLPHIKAGSSVEPNPPHSIPATGCSVCQPHVPAPPGDTASLTRGHRRSREGTPPAPCSCSAVPAVSALQGSTRAASGASPVLLQPHQPPRNQLLASCGLAGSPRGGRRI